MRDPLKRRSRSLSISDADWAKLTEDADRAPGRWSVSALITHRALRPRPEICSCYAAVSETLHEFLSRNVVRDETASVSLRRLHAAYARWARTRLLTPMDRDTFRKAILHECSNVGAGRSDPDDPSSVVMFGLRLRQKKA